MNKNYPGAGEMLRRCEELRPHPSICIQSWVSPVRNLSTVRAGFRNLWGLLYASLGSGSTRGPCPKGLRRRVMK